MVSYFYEHCLQRRNFAFSKHSFEQYLPQYTFYEVLGVLDIFTLEELAWGSLFFSLLQTQKKVIKGQLLLFCITEILPTIHHPKKSKTAFCPSRLNWKFFPETEASL